MKSLSSSCSKRRQNKPNCIIGGRQMIVNTIYLCGNARMQHPSPSCFGLAALFAAAVLGCGSTAGTSTTAPGTHAAPKPAATTRTANHRSAEPLPLDVGATWTYRAKVIVFDSDTQADITTELTWTTEVVDMKQSDGVTAYAIKGWPSDLLGMENGTVTPNESVLLRTVDSVSWGSRLDSSPDSAESWLRLPLKDGQKLCPDPEIVYCWTVEASSDGYRLTFYTSPDEESYLLKPGIGIVEYRYIHHGTTLDVHATLIDYKPGKRP